MKKIADVNIASAARSENNRPSHMCAEPGCPMYGTIADTPGGERKYCRFHFGVLGPEAARMTTILRNRIGLVDEVHRLRRAAAYGGPDVPENASRLALDADMALSMAVRAATPAVVRDRVPGEDDDR